jgi:hypothetical protein
MRPLSESTILCDLAEGIGRRIARQVIRTLQGMTETRMSGEGSGLTNVWDEVCVQVQFEESVFWDAYAHTVTSLATGEFAKLAEYEKEAVWLQSPEGISWSCEDEGERESAPVYDPDAIDHLVREFVYAEAGRWSNPQIRKFMDGSCS